MRVCRGGRIDNLEHDIRVPDRKREKLKQMKRKG